MPPVTFAKFTGVKVFTVPVLQPDRDLVGMCREDGGHIDAELCESVWDWEAMEICRDPLVAGFVGKRAVRGFCKGVEAQEDLSAESDRTWVRGTVVGEHPDVESGCACRDDYACWRDFAALRLLCDAVLD